MAKQAGLKTNFLYNLAYQVLAIVLPLVTAPYVSRTLGSQGVGAFSYAQARANYFYLFAMLGVASYGNRTVAAVRDRPAVLRATFWEIYAFQFITGCLASLVYLAFCLPVSGPDGLVGLLQLLYVASGWFGVNWFLSGLEKFRLAALRSAAVRLGMAAAVFLFVKDAGDVPVYASIIAGGNLLSALAVWPFVLRRAPFVRPSLRGVFRHIKPNLVLFWPVVAVSLYNVMDKLMLGAMAGPAEVGLYACAENVAQIPNTLILALDNVMLPRMANLYAIGGDDRARALMGWVMRLAALAASAMAFGLAAMGPAFAPWFYGPGFARCGLFIALLCPVIVFKGWAGALRTQYILPNKKDRVYLISLTCGALVNLSLNLLLIPRWRGVGAVVGTVAAEFTVAFLQFFLLRRELPIGSLLPDGLAFCAAGLVMYAAVYPLRALAAPPPLVMAAQAALGGTLYLALTSFYLVKIARRPDLVHWALGLLRIKRRFPAPGPASKGDAEL